MRNNIKGLLNCLSMIFAPFALGFIYITYLLFPEKYEKKRGDINELP